jgi:pimeloyl-ACP methyl ester carboxylesterase
MTAGFALTAGLTRPVVLGWGLGGEIALSLAERHPALVSSLVLVDTSAGGLGSVPPTREVVRLLGLAGVTPTELAKLLFPDTAAGLQERVLWPSSLRAGTTDWLTSPSIEAEAKLQAAFWEESPLTGGLGKIAVPALVVSGSDDIVFPPEDAVLLSGELVHATQLTLSDAGYGSITQDEATFVAALTKFTS